MFRPARRSGPRLLIETDGGARNNPGPAAFAYVIRDETGRVLEKRAEYIGDATSNVAEYKGMLAAARRAVALGAADVEFRVDSELLERQVNGQYKVKSHGIRPLFVALMAALRDIPDWTVRHVSREQNSEADRLVNMALDRQGDVA